MKYTWYLIYIDYTLHVINLGLLFIFYIFFLFDFFYYFGWGWVYVFACQGDVIYDL